MLKGVESLNSIESIAMGYASYFVGSVHHPGMLPGHWQYMAFLPSGSLPCKAGAPSGVAR